MTFSIVARSADGESWGVAVASKFLAVGSAVPAAAAGIGAIATQSFANTAYKPQALASGAEPAAMTQRFEMQVTGGPSWAVDTSGNTVFTFPGWNSVRDPSNRSENLPLGNMNQAQYKVKFVTDGLSSSDSVLLATPVLDDVTLFFTSGAIEILEYVVL